MESLPVIVREVWQNNVDLEFRLIRYSLTHFHLASFDTEFPGTVFSPTHISKHLFSSLHASQLYLIMKENVNALNLIQFGLTLSDEHGNLPTFGTKFQYIWQFNFRDFDCDHHLHNPDSIALLKRQGIDFLKNKQEGIDSRYFAVLFEAYGLNKCSGGFGISTWVTFHGLYDYGYMIKILTGRNLPETFKEYLVLLLHYFGSRLYDLKPMSQKLGVHGGLDKIARIFNIDRDAGTSHQAGSDSLLTMKLFLKLIWLIKPVIF